MTVPLFTPRTPKGWMRFLLRFAAWAVLILGILGAITWVFFGTQGLMVYIVALVYLLIACACGTPAVLFYFAHRAKVRSGEFGTSEPVKFGTKK